MRKVAVLGAGRFGWSLAQQLTGLGADVLVLDTDENKINMADETVAQAVCVDVTNESALRKLNLADVDIAVVCLGDNVEGSLLATTVLQRIGVKEVWVRAVNEVQTQILQALKVDRILSIENEMGKQTAHSLVNPGMHAFLSLTPEHSVVEIRAKKAFIGKTLREMDFRNSYGVNIVAIKSTRIETANDGTQNVVNVINDLPWPDDVVKEDDILVLIGSAKNLARLQKL